MLRPQSNTRQIILNNGQGQFLPVIPNRKLGQRVIPFPVKVQSLNDQIDMRKAKRCKGIGRRRKRKDRQMRGQKISIPSESLCERKILDGFLLLHSCRVKNPQEAIKSRLTGENIAKVE